MSGTEQLSVPTDGSSYASWDELRQALNDWAIKVKFAYKVAKKEPTRATYCCRNENCSWKCRVRKDSTGLLLLTIAESQHSCVGAALGQRRAASNHTWLDDAVSKHLHVTKATTPKAIVDCVRIHYSEEISYKVAQNTRLRLLSGDLGNQRYSFQLLPSYMRLLELAQPGVYTDIARDEITSNESFP